MNAALQERELRIDLLTRRLEAKMGEFAAAVKHGTRRSRRSEIPSPLC